MNLSEGTILQIIVYLCSMAATAGAVLWRIKALEKKVDKHNQLVERMAVVETSCKQAHHRIDDICKNLEKVLEKLEKVS